MVVLLYNISLQMLTSLLCCLAMWYKAERVQLHATSSWAARTAARNWRLRQSQS